MAKKGLLIRVRRGVYQFAGTEDISEHHTLAVAACAVPYGVICLLSALAYHEIGTQIPSEVWIGVAKNRRTPAGLPFPNKVIWFSERFMQSGIATHQIEGVDVSITTPVRTVVDCFKFRNTVGLDVALEALREGINGKVFTRNAIAEEARNCRQWNVLRPYLESLSI